MKLSQRRSIEKETGMSADCWSQDVLDAFFAQTDRGMRVVINTAKQEELDELLTIHKWHAVTVEMWKEDFRSGLLSLLDFLNEDTPIARKEHAFDIYYQVFGYIPKCFRQHPDCPTRWRT